MAADRAWEELIHEVTLWEEAQRAFIEACIRVEKNVGPLHAERPSEGQVVTHGGAKYKTEFLVKNAVFTNYKSYLFSFEEVK